MKIRKSLVFALVAGATGLVFGAAGDTYVWTGAVDGKWMNAANWTLNGVPASVPPGIPMSEVTTSDKKIDTISAAGLARKGEKVEFGACATANTTIDFDGLYSIGQITVKAGAPAYTFGTSATQILPLESGSGKLVLESGLENMPILAAVFSVGAATSTRDSTVYIENNADKEFVIGDIGDVRSTTTDTWGFSFVYLQGSGTGGYRLTGAHVFDQGKIQTGLKFYVKVPKVTVASTVGNMSVLEFQSGSRNVEILKDGMLSFGGLNGNYIYGAIDGCSITGEGILQFKGGPTATDTKRARIYAYKNCTLEIAVAFEMAGASSGVEPDVNMYGNSTAVDQNGTVYFSGENRAQGCLAFIDGNDRTCKVGPDGLPAGETVRFFANGTLATAWTNEATLARTFSVGNGLTACVGNAGMAPLTADVAVAPLDAGSVTAWLGAKAQTAPIALNAVFTDGQSVGLLIDGAETVSLSAATLAGVSAIRLKGGVLDASAVKNWSPSVPVTFDTGAATLLVPDGETYVLSSLARSAGDTKGTLNIICGTGRVRIQDASSGAAPAGVLVNGLAAEIREGGVIAPVAPAVDVAIAAKGDTVPNAPAQVVGITTEGSGGNDTLAAAATTVKGLVHIAAADSTIEIGEERNLTADKVTLAGFAGNLNIGKSGDAGTFGAAGGETQLERDDVASDLTIRAKLADGHRIMVDGGVAAATLAGGSDGTNTIVIKDGKLTVSGERTFDFDVIAIATNRLSGVFTDLETWPTLRFDGAKDVRIGLHGVQVGYPFLTSGYSSTEDKHGRLIVTNSLIRSDNIDRSTYPSDTKGIAGEENAIVVGNRCGGFMEVQAGAVITNRLVVGCPASGHRGLGAVVQTGGEMAALGQYEGGTPQYGSGVGPYGGAMGVYELAGGKLVALGPFCVGGFGTGFLNQSGGAFVVTAHPSDTAASPNQDLCVGFGNSAKSYWRVSGGTVDVGGVLRMSGGSRANSSWSYVTFGGTAEVDLHDNPIYMVNTGTALEALHVSNLSINDNAILRASGFCDLSRPAGDADPTYRKVVVGFNGGTFVTGGSGRMVFHRNSSTAGVLESAIEHVVVYEGGATFDTDGKTGNVIDVPLKGAVGGGVAEIPFALTEKQSQYFLPPNIEIEGDGVGASAVVEWDWEKRAPKGVKITSAGINYTWAKAIFRLGGSAVEFYLFTNDCVIAANENTGSLTKKGDGDLRLLAVNTYGGDTVLKGGVLKLEVTGALPEGSAIVPEGGIIEVANGVELPETIQVKIANPDPNAKYDLIQFAGEVPETLPTFTFPDGTDPNWRVRLVGKTLRASYRKGLLMLVR